jgi:phosphatidylinositol phospholipase C beta
LKIRSIAKNLIRSVVDSSSQIISGQFLCDKRNGTYVEVDMYGLPADTARRRRTRVIPNNGLNPVYGDDAFIFKKVILPELACLRFAAYEESGKMIGHRVVPIVGLRPGYRHIPLKNESGQPLLMPSLFVHVTVKDYVPEEFSDIADALSNPIAYQSAAERRAKLLEQVEINDDDDRTVSQASGRVSSSLIQSQDSVSESNVISVVNLQQRSSSSHHDRHQSSSSSTPPPPLNSTAAKTSSSTTSSNDKSSSHQSDQQQPQQHLSHKTNRPPLVHQGSKSSYTLSSLLGGKKRKDKMEKEQQRH